MHKHPVTDREALDVRTHGHNPAHALYTQRRRRTQPTFQPTPFSN
ncbi:hypothetical protein ACSHXN_41075 [Streptomyces sp. HUAS TT11]